MGIQQRREREFQRREAEILRAALELFSGDDWQSVTVEQIARRAEIGKGTVYKHFASKDEIYARLALDFYHGILGRLRDVDPGLSVLARLRAMIRVVWDEHLRSREYHRVVMYCARDDFRASVSPTTRAAFEAVDRDFEAIVHAVVQQGMEQQVFPRMPARRLLYGAQSAFNGAVMLAWGGCVDPADQDHYLDDITNFILAGLIYQDRRFE